MKRMICSLIVTSVTAGYLSAQTPPPAPPAAVPAAPTRQQQEGKVQNRPTENLTEEQRVKLRAASDLMRKEQTANYEKMRAVRKSLDELTKGQEVDETAIRAKALELGKIEGELALIRAKHYKELRGILPKDQFERAQATGVLPGSPALEQRLNTIVNRTNVPAAARPGSPPPRPLELSPEKK